MSNLANARAALEAQIDHAKQGMLFYQSQIATCEALIGGIAKLEATADANQEPSLPTKRARKPNDDKAEPTATPPAKEKKKSGRKATGELPFTGGDFWTNLVTKDKRSFTEILDAAIATFDFVPTNEQREKLQGRLTTALNGLVKTGAISDEGERRQRRYFKK